MAIFDRTILAPILWFATTVVAAFGFCVGSFLNVVVWRLPLGMSLSHPGSHCPKCGHAIRAWENIPILSWLLLRGRCSQCGLPISIRYPLVEAATGLLWIALWRRLWATGLPLTHGPAWFFLGSVLVAVTLIDIEHFLIPDKLNLVAGIAAIGSALAFPETYALGEQGPSNVFSCRLARLLGDAAGNPRVWALARLAGGALVGFGMLWVVRKLGRMAWGHDRTRTDSPTDWRVVDGALTIGAGEPVQLADLLLYPEDRITVHCESGRCTRKSGEDEAWQQGTVSIGMAGIRHGGEAIPWEEGTELHLRATAWAIPREVLGLGDLKLMAVLGAFLGPDASLFIVALGALAGLLVAGGWRLVARGRKRAVPFGPFLAFGALAWLFAGPEALGAYASWLRSLLGAPL
jgi:leader peptidase (prepilin peptidase)/N-methyltransferase